MRCRVCGFDGSEDEFEEDFQNHLGYFCPCCDSFSYISDKDHERRQFLLWLEDLKAGKPLTEKLNLKQNVSPLRYPGGKTKLLPYVAACLAPETKRIVEPFCGGASISLGCLLAGLVEEIHINDADKGVVALFRTILSEPEWLIDRLFCEKPENARYFQYRKSLLQEEHLPDRERGFRYLYCNRIAFSGILFANPTKNPACRYNPKTLAERISRIYKKRDHIIITNNDALTVIEEEYWRGEETLLFIDPPYYKKGPSLYQKAYSEKDHETLSFLVESLYRNAPGANIIITYDHAAFIKDLYSLPETEIIKPYYSCITCRPSLQA